MKKKAKNIPRRRKRRYTKRDEMIIIRHWGIHSITLIAEKLERTPCGIVNYAKKMGIGPPSERFVSLRELQRRLGYGEKAIKIAAKRSGISLRHRRLPTCDIARNKNPGYGCRYGFDEDDIDAITKELLSSPHDRIQMTRHGEWGTGKKPDACLDCGKNDKRHQARGLCTRCYSKRLRDKVGFEDRDRIGWSLYDAV